MVGSSTERDLSLQPKSLLYQLQSLRAQRRPAPCPVTGHSPQKRMLHEWISERTMVVVLLITLPLSTVVFLFFAMLLA